MVCIHSLPQGTAVGGHSTKPLAAEAEYLLDTIMRQVHPSPILTIVFHRSHCLFHSRSSKWWFQHLNPVFMPCFFCPSSMSNPASLPRFQCDLYKPWSSSLLDMPTYFILWWYKYFPAQCFQALVIYEECSLLSCNAVQFGENLTFRRNVSPPFSGQRNKLSTKPARSRPPASCWFLAWLTIWSWR
jgi:hypothetical protein